MSLILGSSNQEYHANKSHLSSSQLKLILKDPQRFYSEYILGNKLNESKSVFDEGTFTHMLVLEPDKIADFAVFAGLRKAGREWEEFKAANPGKIILSAPQVARCEKLYQSYASMPVAAKLISEGLAEHNMVGMLMDVALKARADYAIPGKDILVDLKTTAMPTDRDAFAGTVREYGYQLSAALYCELYRQTYGRLCDFYWVVLSKDDYGCAVYKASTETLSEGTSQVTKALILYKKCLASGLWQPNQPKHDFSTNDYGVLDV